MNTLHGYTRPMDLSYMRDTVTPLPADRSLPFHISTYGETIEGGLLRGQEPRRGDGSSRRGNARGFPATAAVWTALLGLQDLLEQGKEYALVLRVRTEKWESIEYYTRLRYYGDTHLAEQLAFARSLSDSAISGTGTEEWTVQLETRSDADNSSLGLCRHPFQL